MKSFRALIKDFFGFSKTQANGFVVLIFISMMVLFSNPLYKAIIGNPSNDFSDEKRTLDSLSVQWKRQLALIDLGNSDNKMETNRKLFHFNPNSVTVRELDSLGFSIHLAKRLINYRAKVGAFRTKSDVRKLYGMDSLFYERLIPFIQLPETVLEKKQMKPAYVRKEVVLFDLNLADTSQLQGVFGIGPVLAKRIVKYRDALGGFVKRDQLMEVYGLDSTVVSRIDKASFLASDFQPRKLNINQLDERAMAAHPYFSKKIAKAIVAYRFQHGNYLSLEDLRKIEAVEKSTLDKVFPYLTVE